MNFESLKFNPFDNSEEILTDDLFDPDLNFFNINIGNLDTPYISHEEHKNLNVNSSADTLSILRLNIRSIKKNFENFKIFLSNLSSDFSIMFFGDRDESSLTSHRCMSYLIIKAFIKLETMGKVVRFLFT